MFELFFYALSQLKCLSYLSFHFLYCKMSNKGVESLSSALTKMKKLNALTLDLEENDIEEKGAESLARALS